MLTTQPYLRTRRPSPTTVEYTVSTSPPLTLPLRLLIAFSILIRVAIGTIVLLLLYSQYRLSKFYKATLDDHPKPSPELSVAYLLHILSILLSTRLGTLLSAPIISRIPLAILVPISLSVLYALTLRRHTTESLLVLRGLGIQTSTSSETYLSTATTRFIPTDKIQDIFINEAFRGFEVRYLLVVVVEGEGDLVVVFPRLLPKRQILEVVWRGARGCLGFGNIQGAGATGKDIGKERRDSTGYGVGKS